MQIYIYLKFVNFIYNIFINYDLLKYQSILFLKKKKIKILMSIFMYIHLHICTNMLFRLKTNILIPKFYPKQKIRTPPPVATLSPFSLLFHNCLIGITILTVLPFTSFCTVATLSPFLHTLFKVLEFWVAVTVEVLFMLDVGVTNFIHIHEPTHYPPYLDKS